MIWGAHLNACLGVFGKPFLLQGQITLLFFKLVDYLNRRYGYAGFDFKLYGDSA
jgi:hypothetical protein